MYMWHRNTLATYREQEVAEVLNYDYRAITSDEVNIFRHMHKFMHSLFDKIL